METLQTFPLSSPSVARPLVQVRFNDLLPAVLKKSGKNHFEVIAHGGALLGVVRNPLRSFEFLALVLEGVELLTSSDSAKLDGFGDVILLCRHDDPTRLHESEYFRNLNLLNCLTHRRRGT
jgi:hypothetical protein